MICSEDVSFRAKMIGVIVNYMGEGLQTYLTELEHRKVLQNVVLDGGGILCANPILCGRPHKTLS